MTITPEQFRSMMQGIQDAHGSSDPEASHGAMDDLMCKLLRDLGYEAGVEIFEQTDKWYA